MKYLGICILSMALASTANAATAIDNATPNGTYRVVTRTIVPANVKQQLASADVSSKTASKGLKTTAGEPKLLPVADVTAMNQLIARAEPAAATETSAVPAASITLESEASANSVDAASKRAAESTLYQERQCKQSSLSLSQSFNGDSAATVMKRYEEKIEEVRLAMKSQGVAEKEQNQSFSFNSPYDKNGVYQGNLSVSYNLKGDAAKKALTLIDMLEKKGYQVSYSLNSYNSSDCGGYGE